MNWLKRIWKWLFPNDVWVEGPSRDQLIYGHDRESLRDRFNRVRVSAGSVPTRTFTDEELIEGYNTRFDLQNMTESVWIPIREPEVLITGSGEKGPWAWYQSSFPSGSTDTRLQFYDYKYIRHILMGMMTFMEKNQGKEGLPFFIYELDPKYVQMLIGKMTARMNEFEPYISKHTTAHTGYWEV